MTTVTVSSKFQVVIPKEIRRKYKIEPGQKFQILQVGDKLEFLPVQNIKESRGFLKGMNTDIKRERDRI